MMLSWLSTSEAHKHTSMYMIWQYESMHKVKERVRESGSIVNTRICFEVRDTALRPRLHTEGFPLSCPHRTLTQGTSTEDLGNTIIGSTQLLSQLQHNLYT